MTPPLVLHERHVCAPVCGRGGWGGGEIDTFFIIALRFTKNWPTTLDPSTLRSHQ